MKNKITIILLSAIIVFITAFAFYNSAKSFKTTHAESEAVVEVINPVFESKKIDVGQEALRLYIRKSAHIIEFALLGAAVMCLVLHIKRQYHKSFFGFAFFYVLMVGVTDEYIQSFRDRSSLVSDVVFDFMGAMIGFVLTFAIVKTVCIIIKKYKIRLK